MHVPKGDPEKGLDPFFAKAYFALISPLSSDPWPHSPLIFRALRKITPRWFYIKFRYAYRYLFSCILGVLLRKHGVSVILRGPFAGMKFVSKPVYGCYLPQILGTYEQEISKFLREILSEDYQTIIDVGCAEGYYAIGLSRANPNAKVYAFDIDAHSRYACHEVAKKNNREGQIILGNICTHQTIREIAKGKTLIFSDCEGYEVDLLQPKKCPALLGCDILVEVHDYLRPEARSLINRFRPTHEVEEALSVARSIDDFPLPNVRWPRFAKAFSLNEYRPFEMRWLWCRAKNKV